MGLLKKQLGEQAIGTRRTWSETESWLALLIRPKLSDGFGTAGQLQQAFESIEVLVTSELQVVSKLPFSFVLQKHLRCAKQKQDGSSPSYITDRPFLSTRAKLEVNNTTRETSQRRNSPALKLKRILELGRRYSSCKNNDWK